MTSQIDTTAVAEPSRPAGDVRAKVRHRPYVLHLGGHPLLCCAPRQWGPGVRTEDNGTLVLDVVRAVVEARSEVITGKVAERLAARFGCGVDHVRQAIDWARQVGLFDAVALGTELAARR